MRQVILNACIYAKQKINLTWPRLTKSVNKNLKLCRLKVLFKTTNSKTIFVLKTYYLKPNRVYKFSCGRSTASYRAKTYSHIEVSEHQGISTRTIYAVRLLGCLG